MDGSFTDEKAHIWLQEVADFGWVSLHYDTPALQGIGACEISGGGYLRQLGTFSQPSNRAIWSLTDLRFPGLVQTQLTHFGVWDSKNDGMLVAYGKLPNSPIVVYNGTGYVIHQGDLALSFG